MDLATLAGGGGNLERLATSGHRPVLAFRRSLHTRAFELMVVTLNTYSNRISSINKRSFSGPKKFIKK